jgi:hypothetical protein
MLQLVQKLAEAMTQLEMLKKSKKGVSPQLLNKREKEIRKLENDLQQVRVHCDVVVGTVLVTACIVFCSCKILSELEI